MLGFWNEEVFLTKYLKTLGLESMPLLALILMMMYICLLISKARTKGLRDRCYLLLCFNFLVCIICMCKYVIGSETGYVKLDLVFMSLYLIE